MREWPTINADIVMDLDRLSRCRHNPLDQWCDPTSAEAKTQISTRARLT
jgi:hypothetical protein